MNDRRIVVKPLLKWPGGKRWVAPFLARVLRPRLTGFYYEPFLGGGAVFLELKPERAVLSDINQELMHFVTTLRLDAERLVTAVWRYSNTAECYYSVRRARPRTAVGAAARFLYLNKTCWGGVYRLNTNGSFNTPFGDSHRVICRRKEAFEAAKAFSAARLECTDFENAVRLASVGDVVYCDPPYSFEGSNGFIRYNERLFSKDDHQRLAKCSREASDRGASVAVSALDDEDCVELYPGWWRVDVSRSSRVSRKSSGRRVVNEVILLSWRPEVDVGAARVVG
jgi:DNA adenine methylase